MLSFLLYKLKQDERAIRVQPWFKINGDKTLRLFYKINQDSVVFDVGGYEGNWASDIFSMYLCNILIFEPVECFFNIIKKRFKQNHKVHVFKFGLAGKNRFENINVDSSSSSIFKRGNETEKAKMTDIVSFLKKKEIKVVDLIKINIEGGEYELLDRMIDSEEIRKFVNIQVQFHDFVPNAKKHMLDIEKKLSKTHRLTYRYEFVWENWYLK